MIERKMSFSIVALLIDHFLCGVGPKIGHVKCAIYIIFGVLPAAARDLSVIFGGGAKSSILMLILLPKLDAKCPVILTFCIKKFKTPFKIAALCVQNWAIFDDHFDADIGSK